MKTRIYLSIIGLMAFSFLFVSCSKDDEGDTVKPVINLLEPEEGAVLKIGDANGVHFEMDIADNEAIASGQKQARVHNHDIKIPADATPGNYHLMVYCLDRSGNETYVARNIVLSTTGGVESEHHHD